MVLATSRELVTQTGHVADSLFEGTGVRALTLIGGANVQNQLRRLREERPQVLIATPGRLAELVFSLQKIKLGNVRRSIPKRQQLSPLYFLRCCHSGARSSDRRGGPATRHRRRAGAGALHSPRCHTDASSGHC